MFRKALHQSINLSSKSVKVREDGVKLYWSSKCFTNQPVLQCIYSTYSAGRHRSKTRLEIQFHAVLYLGDVCCTLADCRRWYNLSAIVTPMYNMLDPGMTSFSPSVTLQGHSEINDANYSYQLLTLWFFCGSICLHVTMATIWRSASICTEHNWLASNTQNRVS